LEAKGDEMSETERGWGGHVQPAQQANTLTFVTHAREKKIYKGRGNKRVFIGK
jgi:hypothetical protein